VLGTIFKGVIRGKTIELDQEPELPAGQEVAVTLHPIPISSTAPSNAGAREALRKAAGAWASETEELDKFLAWNRQQRQSRRPEIPE
jgi:hypothetical protein